MEPAIDSSGIASLLVNPDVQQGSAREAVPTLLGAIRRHLGMDVAFVSEFANGRRIFRYVDSPLEDAPHPGDSDPLETTHCKLVADGRLPGLIRNARQVPATDALFTRLPVGAQLSVPVILSDGTTYGAFCCFSRMPDASLSERDLAMVRVFADLAGQVIEKDLDTTQRHDEVRKRIADVLASGKLSSVFQPMYSLKERTVAGFECLSRFAAEPRQGPGFWFAEAAAVGMGAELELGALRRALPALAQLPKRLALSFNVSPQLLLDGGLQPELEGIAQRVVVEITEHETVKEYERLVTALAPLRKLGVRVAIDDAGAGYASFRHIVKLEPDIIKLDLSLTRDIDHDPARRALASALIRYARETKSEIIAEGVETQAELDTLLGLGITKAQGYFFGKPMPLAEAVKLIR